SGRRCPPVARRSPQDRREVEEVDAALDRPSRERMATVVEATVFESGGSKRGRPFAVAELLGLHVAASSSGEEEWRVDPRWHRVECVQNDLPERHGSLRNGFRSLL